MPRTRVPMPQSREGALAGQIVQALRGAGHTAYFAGGCVRDLVMGRPAEDHDVATDASPERIEALFERTVPVGKQFGVILVALEGVTFEVATFRAEGAYEDGRHPTWVKFVTAKEDAERRDFTVNGLFYDPAAQEVIDFVGGEADIRARVIRAIGDPRKRFAEDKLRLLRAVRFASNLDFEIEKNTWEAVRAMGREIGVVSQERIREELMKLFTRPGAGRGLRLLSEAGLLKEILPEIERMKGVEQPPEFHPEGDVFVHTCLLMDKLQTPSVTLAFGALLHDVGKPDTFERAPDRIRFNGHDALGGRMAEEILKRLRFPNKAIEEVKACVENHMKFKNVRDMREGKLKRFMATDTFLDELEMHRVDCLSSHGNLDNYNFLKAKLASLKEEELKPKPFLTGHDFLALGLKPGPRIGTLLEEAYDLQLDGTLKTREDALSWAHSQL